MELGLERANLKAKNRIKNFISSCDANTYFLYNVHFTFITNLARAIYNTF